MQSIHNKTVDLADPTQVREDVDRFLNGFFVNRVQRAAALHPQYGRLWQTIHTIYLAGGKRYRPYLTVLTYQAFGGINYEKVVPIAAATEVLHMALLAMDDVFDRDYMRHGQPNIAGMYLETYAEALPDQQERRHFADSAAILAESLLLIASHTIMATAKLSEAERQQVLSLLDDATFIEAGGELLDVEAAFVPPSDRADWKAIARYKTAQYSFITPMQLGAVLAGVSDERQEVLRQIGDLTGIVYQLADDLLGIFSDEVETGKPAYSDIEEGKHTYLMDRTLDLAGPEDKRWLEAILGTKPVTQADGARIRAIMEQSGGKAETEALITRYAAQAKDLVAQLELCDAAAGAIVRLIDKASWRRS